MWAIQAVCSVPGWERLQPHPCSLQWCKKLACLNCMKPFQRQTCCSAFPAKKFAFSVKCFSRYCSFRWFDINRYRKDSELIASDKPAPKQDCSWSDKTVFMLHYFSIALVLQFNELRLEEKTRCQRKCCQTISSSLAQVQIKPKPSALHCDIV